MLSFAEQAKLRRRPVWPVWRLLALQASKRRAGSGYPFGVERLLGAEKTCYLSSNFSEARVSAQEALVY